MPKPITVGELINLLDHYPADMPVTISVWVRRNTRWYLGGYTQSAPLSDVAVVRFSHYDLPDQLYLTAMPEGAGGSIPNEEAPDV